MSEMLVRWLTNKWSNIGHIFFSVYNYYAKSKFYILNGEKMADETGLGGTDKLKMFIDLLSPDQKDQLLEILLQENKDKKKNYGEPIPELIGNFDNVLKYIKDKCVKIQRKEVFGFYGSMITIELPAVGEFEGFKFQCFKSDNEYDERLFDNVKTFATMYTRHGTPYDEKTVNNSGNSDAYKSLLYSMEDIGEVFQKINEFLMAYGVGDGKITDFSDALKSRKYDGVDFNFAVGKVLNSILADNTDIRFMLSDALPNSRACLRFYQSKSYFGYTSGKCKLLFKM